MKIIAYIFIEMLVNISYNYNIGRVVRVKKVRIYLDTSVISHLKQEDVPEKMHDTLDFWELLKHRNDVEVVISELVMREIKECNEKKLEYLLEKLSEINFTLIEPTQEYELAQTYLSNGVLREKSMDDLIHIAIATLNDCKYIVSWNFKHFVNPKTIKAVNAINDSLNLGQVNIVPPSMMLGGF